MRSAFRFGFEASYLKECFVPVRSMGPWLMMWHYLSTCEFDAEGGCGTLGAVEAYLLLEALPSRVEDGFPVAHCLPRLFGVLTQTLNVGELRGTTSVFG